LTGVWEACARSALQHLDVRVEPPVVRSRGGQRQPAAHAWAQLRHRMLACERPHGARR